MARGFLIAAALLAATVASAQTEQPQTYPPPQAAPPPSPPAQTAPPPSPPAQTAPAQTAPAQPSAPPSAAGSQGTSSTAQPGSPGAPSQQVVVNPAPPDHRDETVAVERREKPNPFATVAIDAAWGGLTGLLVGFGVSLVNSFDDWERNLRVGAGAGVLVGAAVGVFHSAYQAREWERGRRVAYGDGMNRTDRDPVVTARTFGYAFRF